MGLDIEIYYRSKEDEPITEYIAIEGEFSKVGPYEYAKEAEPEDRPFGCYDVEMSEMTPKGATHGLSSMTRFYDVHYARGPWPFISATLLSLLANPEVEQVWYGSDASPPQPFTLDCLEKINKFYYENETRPYYANR